MDRAAGFTLPFSSNSSSSSSFAPVPSLSEPPVAPVEMAPVQMTPVQAEQMPAAPVEAPAPAAAAPAGGVMGGLGNLLSRLYQSPARPEAAPRVSQASEPVSAPIPRLDVAPVELPVELPVEVQADWARDLDALPASEAVPVLPTDDMAPLPQAASAPVFRSPEPQPQAQPEVTLPVPSAAGYAPQNAVWFGAYLRRDANLHPAAELIRQLSGALGQDVPLALLVARAAARHADALGLESLAVHSVGAGRACPVQTGGLRDALAALDSEFEATPDLLVIDAGALDLDDLHLPHTLTLSVGRVQGGRAALTLNGDVDPAQGARFLAGVAATLEEPIILVI